MTEHDEFTEYHRELKKEAATEWDHKKIKIPKLWTRACKMAVRLKRKLIDRVISEEEREDRFEDWNPKP